MGDIGRRYQKLETEIMVNPTHVEMVKQEQATTTLRLDGLGVFNSRPYSATTEQRLRCLFFGVDLRCTSSPSDAELIPVCM